jgi:outer membrane protein TolC
MRSRIGGVLGNALLALAAASSAGAASPPPEPATRAWEPQVFVPPPAGLGLLEAVRLTLEQDPNLILLAEDAHAREGVATEQSGAFDWVLSGQASWEHREQELRQSVVDAERDKRRQIADAQSVACELESDLGTKLDDLALAQTSNGVDIRTDRGFNAQLRIIEAAILAAANAGRTAQRDDLIQTRANLIATEIAFTREALGEASQACREAGEDLRRLGGVPEEEEFDIGRLELKLQKLARNGVLFGPFLRGAYDSTDYVGKRRGFIVPALDPHGQPRLSPSGIPLDRLIDFGGKNIEDLYTFEIGFEVNVPLLRGRGRSATGAGEEAARIDHQAAKLLLEHGASESALNTAFAYWNLVAAEEQVRVLEASVGRLQKLLEDTRALVDADELPGSELARSVAGEANAQAQLEDARRGLATARFDLVRAMGLAAGGAEAAAVAADPFPPAPERAPLAEHAEGLAAEAVARRRDLAAARLLVDSGRVLAVAAGTDLRPRLDVTAAGWWTARGEKSVSTALDHTASEPSWRLRAELDKPIGNHTFRGRLVQQEALLGQRRVSADDLERLIRVAAARTLGELTEATAQLGHAERAAAEFEKTVEAEFEKMRLGETTLIDAILTEQQQTSGLLAVVFARLQVATLLAQLRFETGTLVETGDTGSRVTLESLSTLPGGA